MHNVPEFKNLISLGSWTIVAYLDYELRLLLQIQIIRKYNKYKVKFL